VIEDIERSIAGLGAEVVAEIDRAVQIEVRVVRPVVFTEEASGA
jgi:hypothetical protein